MKTKIPQKNNIVLRIGMYFSGTMMALLIMPLFGTQSAHAAVTSQLDFGDRGSEVTELQTYLAANASLYPEGLVTGYYGQLTKAAIERFQTAHGIVSQGTAATTGYGRVGPRTQAALNAELWGGGSGVVNRPAPTGDVFAPAIHSINVSTDSNGASITWTTSEASIGKVYYSTSPIRIGNTFDVTGVFSGEPTVSGTLAQHDGLTRATHTVNINNLTPNTTYFYLVVVYDSSKNVSISTPASFRIN